MAQYALSVNKVEKQGETSNANIVRKLMEHDDKILSASKTFFIAYFHLQKLCFLDSLF